MDLLDLNEREVSQAAHTAFKCIDAIQQSNNRVQALSLALCFAAVIEHLGLNKRELLTHAENVLKRAVEDGNTHARALQLYCYKELKR